MKIKSVAIIGATGRMGTLFADRAAKAGYEVRGMGRPRPGDELSRVLSGADMALLSVPASALAETAALAAGHMDPGAVMADVTSVKARPMADMLSAWDGPVVGTHPLFGPDGGGSDFARVAVVHGRGAEAAQAVADWFTALGFDCFVARAEEHDRAVAHIQSLNYITTVAYLATLAHDDGIIKYLTPSFKRRLDAAKKMLTQDADMFNTLFESNPFAQDAVRRFRSVLSLAAAGDVNLIAERALWWWWRENQGGSA